MISSSRLKQSFSLILLCLLASSCFNVEQVDNSKIQDELRLVKPMKISDGELMAVAQNIGDSLLIQIPAEQDGVFKKGIHEVLVASQNSDTLSSTILKKYYDAFNYAVEKGEEIPSDVKKNRRTDYVSYHTAKYNSDSTLKLIAMRIKVKEITVKIAKKRAQEKLMRKLAR